MQLEALSPIEKQVLRGRMVLFLALSITLICLCALMAQQALQAVGSVQYAWYGGLVLLMVFFVGAFMLFIYRLWDLVDGHKRILVVEVSKKEETGGKHYLWFLGKRQQVGLEFFELVRQEGQIEIHHSRKGFVLATIPHH